MIKFTDPRLYVQGIGSAIMTDLANGDIVYFSDKFTDGNTTMSADDGIISAGIGNAPAIMIPSNMNIAVALTAADYNEYAKAASIGGVLTVGAPDMVCQTVTATGTSISVDLSGGTPIAGLGQEKVLCYVQEIGAESLIATGGVAYEINPATGAVSGFVAINGKQYLVTYHVSRANASLTTITTNPKGKVVRFVFSRPIYTNVESAANQGDLWGMMYEIIPRLQLMPDGASNSGSQTGPTTTGITGRAMSYDAETIEAGCDACAQNGVPLMYRVIVPCDNTQGIDGILAQLGGEVSVKTGETVALNPAVVVNNTLSFSVPVSEFTFTSSATGTATVGQHTGIVAGVAAGSCEVEVSYTVGTTTYTDTVNVEVTSA